MARGFKVRIDGEREAARAFRALPEEAREVFLGATETTASEIVRLAKANIVANPSIRTRSLLNAIGYSINRKTGLARVGIRQVSTTLSNPQIGGIGRSTVRVKGIVTMGRGGSALTSQGARLVRPTKYGHLVEFGHQRGGGHGAARPEAFMKPAAKTEEQPYLARCRAAGRDLEARMGRYYGGRHL